ncbi:squalene monooxygenase [Heterostelium album PN500]|uniref:Squalene monooxygenase n=1 Tax=Heterostelium pallidum (strain ATCC 26659 / Pp 5 / PN500) TaxID=670386 RepID=D3BMA3_HETP5|nr:squalene monooxygenase [Heterostelium album PN500]EFA77704.1 squalene monooxygenase [Heterostelium album PN500]|eukprot:XP_020429832.1 squalene monooxygenase [Heterostelium album PN500]
MINTEQVNVTVAADQQQEQQEMEQSQSQPINDDHTQNNQNQNDNNNNSKSNISVDDANNNNNRFDVIIVGAGVAGSILARTLGVSGRRVLCVERDLSEPDRIVGELMQPGGVRALQALGMGECFDGIDATPAYGYGIFKGTDGVRLSYPRESNNSPAKVANGFSFHHGRFVQKLRNMASMVAAVNLVQGTVKSLIEDDSSNTIVGIKYTTQLLGGDALTDNDKPQLIEREAFAPLTIVVDGCFSNLRKSLTNQTPLCVSTFVGDCNLPFPDHGHVFLVDPSPILMYRIGSNEIRVLVDVPGSTCPPNSQLRVMFEKQTAPQLPESLREPFLQSLRNEQLKKMPNSRLHPDMIDKKGVIVLGDAWNMRHPLTGAGMTVAIADVRTLTCLLAPLSTEDLGNSQKMDAVMKEFQRQRTPLASTLNVLAGALYKVFSADNEHLRKACLGYLSLGGEFSAGPVALLSGLRPKPSVLAMHFFAVAFYGIFKTLWPFPTPGRIVTAYRILCAASDIVVPLLHRERTLRGLTFLCRFLRLTKQ